MAAGSLGTLTLDLIAKIGGFTGPLDKASRNAKKNSDEISKTMKNIAIAAGAVGAAAAAGFAVMVKSSLDAADELYKHSQIVGMSVEQLSALKFTAGEAGVEFELLSGSLGKFNKNIFDAVNGKGAALEAFADLGIDLKGVNGELKSTPLLFEEVATKLSILEDGATKAALAQELFGKSGKDLIPLLNAGADGLREGAEEAARLNQVMSTEAARAAEEFNDNLSRLQKSISGVANAAAKEAAPGLAEMTAIFADPEVQNGIARMASGLIDIGTASVKALSELSNFAGWVGEEIAARVHGINSEDVVRLEQLLDSLEAQREKGFFTRASNYRDDGVLEEAIRKTREQIELLYKQQEQASLAAIEASKESAFMAELEAQGWEDSLVAVEGLTAAQIEARRAGREAAEEQEKLAVEAQKNFARMEGDLQKQIDLWGNKSKAVELAYDLERGLIAGLDPVRQKQLVALAEQIDLLQQQSDLMDELDEFGWDEAFNIDGISDDLKKFTTFSEDAFERINGVAADTWVNFANGAEDAFGGVKQMFIQTLAEMAHEALTKPILLNVQQSLTGSKDGGGSSGSGGSSALGSVGVGGIYAAGAIAAIAAVNNWNKQQDEKFQKMTAEYRQGTQSLGTILGSANQKSDSLAEALLDLNGLSSDMLSVNYGMYQSLQSIDKGINGVAAGFARQFGLSGVGGAVGVTEFSGAGLKRLGEHGFIEDLEKYAAQLDIIGGDFITEFAGGIMNGINKGVFSKSKRIIDEGIQFTSQTLSDILADGLVEAFAYADVKTQKKVLGIKTSVKVGTETQALDDILLGQLSGVFVNAREVLDQSADVFGIDFENYINRLSISEQKLSLKDLEGDALVKEIESFFSKTLDNWAGVLLDGTDALRKYQEVGEGAFETMMRLAAETVSFTDAAKLLQLNFGAVNMEAVDAVQSLSDAAGGFDLLSSGLNNYANKFLDDADKFKNAQDKMSASFAELGLEIPKTRDEFKALIQNGVADPELFTSLLAMVDATDLYLSALEKQQQATEANAKALADLLAPFEGQLATAGMTEFELSLYQVSQSLEGAIAKAQALGASEEQLAMIRGASEKELEKITADRVAALDELMGGYADALAKSRMNDFEAQVYDLNKSLGNAVEQAQALGASEEQLAMIRDASALQMQALYASETDAALAALRGAIDGQVARETNAAQSKFAAINNAASAAFGNIDNALSSQIENANRWLDTQQNLYDKQAQGIEQSVNALRGLGTSLRDAADQMRYVGLVNDEISRAAAMRELDASISLARDGGAIDADRIGELIGRVQVDQSRYSTAFDYEQEVAVTAAKLDELAGLTESRASFEERSLAGINALRENAIQGNNRLIESYALNMREQIAAIHAAAEIEIAAVDDNSQAQISELERQYEAYVAQIDALRGIDNSVITVADAIERLNVAIENEQAAFRKSDAAVAITNVAQTNVMLLDEFRKLREENHNLQTQIVKNTGETSYILWTEQQMAVEEGTGT